MTDFEDFKNNTLIKEGLHILYPQQATEQVIEGWRNKQLSNNEIIREINNQI